jgi:hypothetical protein
MPYLMNDTPKPRPFLTDWYPPGVEPVRDGVYLTVALYSWGRGAGWHAMRWNCKQRSWFYAERTSDRPSKPLHGWAWRGLAQEPKP